LLILPLFAFVNAGVSLGGGALDILTEPVTLGVMAGLVLGKVSGISLMSWLAVRWGLAQLPEGVTWPHVVGAGLLGGVGFTMSLFVSELAFETETVLNSAKLGILVASLTAGVSGYLVLRTSLSAKVNEA
jgi:NhaA family Na+:H+ antiporter